MLEKSPFAEDDFPVYRREDLFVVVSLDLKHGNRSASHELRASVLRTTKKKKTKNPWRELRKANIHWRAKAALLLVVTPTAVNSDRINL